MNSIEALLEHIFSNDPLLYAVFSSPLNEDGLHGTKVTIRPIEVKGKILFQATVQKEGQALHRNETVSRCRQMIEELIVQFKQGLLCTPSADYQTLTNKKLKTTILKKAPTKQSKTVVHNLPKNYQLQEGDPIPFLVALGVMTKEGKVVPSKRDKFRQLNRFVEIVADIASSLPQGRKLNIVDFGCGKAYLTFALYHYLTTKEYEIEIQGLDLKQDVIEQCESLARQLKYHGLHFKKGDINEYESSNKVDMMISLHACDTATDAAIEKAIRWQSDVILCVPCCQHELMNQIYNEPLAPLLKHGILKERFASLATDAARAQLLDILGYQTQVIEFIDLEHTPKNLLIRALKRKKPSTSFAKTLREYHHFKNALHIEPSLETRFRNELQALTEKGKSTP